MSEHYGDWDGENGLADEHEHEIAAEYEAEVRAQYEAEMRAEYMADMMANMPSPAEIAQYERERKEHELVDYQKTRADAELKDFHVNWLEITLGDIKTLKRVLDHARSEEDVQQFLTGNKQFLIQHLAGGHGRYVLSKPRLGTALIPDYLLAEEDSAGIHWHAVELESPLDKMFTGSGQPTAKLTHAIQQVVEWREWLTNNIDYARKPVAEGGLSLIGIDGNLPVTILMGRRRPYPEKSSAFRRQTERERRIAIHSYDWLIDQAEGRASALEKLRRTRGS